MATDYAKKTNAELVEILKSRNLPHTGKKADMVSRLQENDTEGGAPAPTENTEDVIDWEDDDVSGSKSSQTATATAPAAAEEPAAAAPAAEETKTEEAAPAAETNQDGTTAEGATEPTGEAEPQAEEKPAPNFSIGLSVTDLEEELKKRKARAEKFGITEDSQAAIDAAEKKLERAKRFKTSGEEDPAKESVGLLDQALPERSRKRGRGENEQGGGGRGGKRRNNGRHNQNQRGRGRGNRGPGQNRNQGQGQGQGQGQSQPQKTNDAPRNWSEKDKEAMDARKKRFGA